MVNSAKILRSEIMAILFKVEDISLLKSIYEKLKVNTISVEKKEAPSFMEAVRQIKIIEPNKIIIHSSEIPVGKNYSRAVAGLGQ